MAKILECVPNFSEGIDKSVVEKILDPIRETEGVKLLDYSSDKDHNRSVVTFLGAPDAVIDAAFKACKVASELIDMRKHKGGHPRMGATDVMPLIPIKDITVEEAVEYSRKLGERIGNELKIPVFLYEKSASAPHRENLADIRRGQYEGMAEKMKEAEWKPDYCSENFNEKSGAVAVGARMPLVAYNINLNTKDVEIAKAIAKTIRAKTGGFTYCKAMGLEIEEKGITQVSMNLTDYTKTGVMRVFEAVKREAARYGVNVIESEIIGLVPMGAIADVAEYYLQLSGFDISQILESRMME
ncbi:MAG: glutamate formimidoyltransferase [Tissierellia bacterium]|nr:glutamate formimidoyltransferase [Tissierellia bacterium]